MGWFDYHKKIFGHVDYSSNQGIMQGKLFQRCTHLLYCSELSMGGNVNTRRMSQPDRGSIFHIKKSMKYSGHRKLFYLNNKIIKFILSSSDTKRTLMHLFLFTNSAQRELVLICTHNIVQCTARTIYCTQQFRAVKF